MTMQRTSAWVLALISLLLGATCTLGCSSSGSGRQNDATTVAGTTEAGGDIGEGGLTGAGGIPASGGTAGSGGVTGAGGTTGTGGIARTGGATGAGGVTVPGGTTGSGGGTAKGGTTGAGGVAPKGGTGSGGVPRTGGVTGAGGVAHAGGVTGFDGALPPDGAQDVSLGSGGRDAVGSDGGAAPAGTLPVGHCGAHAGRYFPASSWIYTDISAAPMRTNSAATTAWLESNGG